MNIKAVVKVMNFHALLRVESSTSLAAKYTRVSEELESMMRIILNNKNLQVDKKVGQPDPSKPPLKIYIASDLGFCGSINSSIASKMSQNDGSDKIIIGKKIKKNLEHLLYLAQEDFEKEFDKVRSILEHAIKKKSYSQIILCYNKYNNLSSIETIEKMIYPLPPLEADEAIDQWTNFAIEGNVSKLLQEMIISYLSYEIKIAVASSFASENTMRQNATTQSLKKLDEIEEEELLVSRKEKSQKSFQKTIDSFIKQKSLKGK